MPKKGNAGFIYDPGTGAVTLALEWPLFRVAPGRFKRRFANESANGAVREVLVIGSALKEISGRIRFADNPEAVLDMLEAGADGIALQYVPDLGSPGTFVTCSLIAPIGDRHDLEVEADRLSYGEYAISVRLRATAGDWSILPGANL